MTSGWKSMVKYKFCLNGLHWIFDGILQTQTEWKNITKSHKHFYSCWKGTYCQGSLFFLPLWSILCCWALLCPGDNCIWFSHLLHSSACVLGCPVCWQRILCSIFAPSLASHVLTYWFHSHMSVAMFSYTAGVCWVVCTLTTCPCPHPQLLWQSPLFCSFCCFWGWLGIHWGKIIPAWWTMWLFWIWYW